MSKLLLGLLLCALASAHAATVDSMFVMGTDPKLLHIINDQHAGYLYAENYQHQKTLIYKSNVPYPPDSTFGSDQIEGTDLLDIMFGCQEETCTRYLNRRTNQLSKIYNGILDYNAKRDVIAYYLRAKSQIIISRVFKACDKPLKYTLEIERDSNFGPQTKFLAMGGLQLDYETPRGKDIIKIIHPNYEKLFNDCS